MQAHLRLVLVASAKLIESAVGLAAPVIVALLLADLALGVVGRVTPALPVYFAAMPLKAVLSVGIVLLGLGALDAALVVGWPAWLALAERGLGLPFPLIFGGFARRPPVSQSFKDPAGSVEIGMLDSIGRGEHFVGSPRFSHHAPVGVVAGVLALSVGLVGCGDINGSDPFAGTVTFVSADQSYHLRLLEPPWIPVTVQGQTLFVRPEQQHLAVGDSRVGERRAVLAARDAAAR